MAKKVIWVPRFAVDGGITNGVAWGCFPDATYGTIAERIARGLKGGGFGTTQLPSEGLYERPEINAVWADGGLLDLWAAWNEQLEERNLYPTKVLLEDFSVGQGAHGVRTRHVISSARVTSAFESAIISYVDEGMEYLHVPKFYSPAESKGFATNERLKHWGLWVVGQQHARDACRLLALDIAKEGS